MTARGLGVAESGSSRHANGKANTTTSTYNKKTKIIGGHAMAIRDFSKSRQGKHAKLYDRSIVSKEFGQDDNNGKDSMCWKNRQKDWYNAERRFIFAAPNDRLKATWIKQIAKEKRKQISAENTMRNMRLGKKVVPAAKPETSIKPSKFKRVAKTNQTSARSIIDDRFDISKRPSAPPSYPPSSAFVSANAAVFVDDYWRNFGGGGSRTAKRNIVSSLNNS